MSSAHILYKNRPEWSDVVPIPQDSEERQVVYIAYNEQFSDTFDYIRAVMLTNEKSERVLELTETALKLNPANYSVWHFRRQVILELNKNSENRSETDGNLFSLEHTFIGQLCDNNSKNYQVWYHRQWLIENLKSVPKIEIKKLIVNELKYIGHHLVEEEKNYHVWQYRSWLVRFFKYWHEEEDFTEAKINGDPYNNSAWNHRFYAIKDSVGFTPDQFEKEKDFVLKNIEKNPDNESSWNYLKGIFFHQKPQNSNLSNADFVYQIQILCDFCEELLISNQSALDSPYLHSFLLDLYILKMEAIKKECVGPLIADKTFATLMLRSIEICDSLAKEIDRIRVNYWNFRKLKLIHDFDNASPSGTLQGGADQLSQTFTKIAKLSETVHLKSADNFTSIAEPAENVDEQKSSNACFN